MHILHNFCTSVTHCTHFPHLFNCIFIYRFLFDCFLYIIPMTKELFILDFHIILKNYLLIRIKVTLYIMYSMYFLLLYIPLIMLNEPSSRSSSLTTWPWAPTLRWTLSSLTTTWRPEPAPCCSSPKPSATTGNWERAVGSRRTRWRCRPEKVGSDLKLI